ncbi:carbon storage regulator [Desulfitispora alkaliphila]|uniref:carbon storage regulator CsrA n=1 Tax=Desulfitispora alkaliphila TaxID=622674 RepID=UPI003D1BDE10
MLILSRKEGEAIVIGKDIKVTVTEVKDGQVRLGIDAPKEVDIFRKELYDAIQQENRMAAAPNITELKEIIGRVKK